MKPQCAPPDAGKQLAGGEVLRAAGQGSAPRGAPAAQCGAEEGGKVPTAAAAVLPSAAGLCDASTDALHSTPALNRGWKPRRMNCCAIPADLF